MKILLQIDDAMLSQFKLSERDVIDGVQKYLFNFQGPDAEGPVPLHATVHTIAEPAEGKSVPGELSQDEQSIISLYRLATDKGRNFIGTAARSAADVTNKQVEQKAEVISLFPARSEDDWAFC